MTTTHAPAARQAGHPGRPLVPGAPSVPQVNLLPPEIRASRSLATLKRVLALVLVAVLALGVAGYFWAGLQVQAAEEALAEQEQESTRLLNAQREFAEVPQVLGQLERATQARLLGTSTEVMWAPFLRSLMATAPRGVAFEKIEFFGSTPTAQLTAPSNPLLLEDQYLGTLAWVGRSATVVDSAAWIEGLESIEGFTDAFVTSVEIGERDVNGTMVPVYEVIGSVQVLPEVLANRFVEQPEDEAADDATDTEDEEAQG